jgi:predicted Zn-ribbon and HTH transcriptional regulator
MAPIGRRVVNPCEFIQMSSRLKGKNRPPAVCKKCGTKIEIVSVSPRQVEVKCPKCNILLDSC